MKREPTQYSRLLIFVGLFPLLVADLFFGLPDRAFVGGGAMIMATAAVIHFYGGEPRAGVGWLFFCAALGLIATVDPTASLLYVLTFGFFLVSGLFLMASQRRRSSGTE